jgi:hypothetical protein
LRAKASRDEGDVATSAARRRRYDLAAAALAAAVVILALVWGTRVAAGADAYGYVSQAALWLKGDLFIDQSFAADAPWPLARWTFTPLGYRPEPDGYRIVPAYAPGLPLLMAATAALAGWCAVFWVVPLAAGVLVFATYMIGTALTTPVIALGAAWIVATSPTVLFMAMAPMSDVPAACLWTVAVALVLRERVRSSAAGGVAAAFAILVRPNLAPLAAVVVVWQIVRRAWRPAFAFGVAAAAGAVAIAVLNARLYGSPLRSGYDLADAFALANIVPNLQRYGWWLVTVETPLAVAGLVALVFPASRVWHPDSRGGRWLLAGMVAAVWFTYLIYVPWDAWWYLRFLLPSWPMMALGSALVIAIPARTTRPAVRALMPIVFLIIGALGLMQAWRHGTFAEWAGESKYVEVARSIESLTAPDDVIISAQHSGTLRFYAGRLTLRWDTGDPAWLDRTVAWLAARGHSVYLLLEQPEIDALRLRSGSVSDVARLEWGPIVTFRGGQVQLFDALNRQHGRPVVAHKSSFTVDRCAAPKPVPPLATRAAPPTLP